MTRNDGAPARPPLRRAAIVETARRLVAEEGLDALSIRNLAGRLGVTAPALYAHVSAKADLLAAIADVELEELADRFASVVADDPHDRLRGMAAIYLGYAAEEPELFTVLGATPPGLHGSRALAVLESAAADGGATDPAAVASAVWAGAHGVAIVSRLAEKRDEASAGALLAAVVDPLLSFERRADRGSR